MLITERKFGIFFKFVNVYFAEEPGTPNIPDCDVVTYHTYKNWGNIKGFYRINCFTTSIDLSQDIDEIWNKIKRQHKRHIRQAEKNDIKVTVSNNYEEFNQIHKRFLKQKNYADPSGLYTLSSQFMQKHGILFIAENQGEILGGNFYFHDQNNAQLAVHAYKVGNTVEEKKRTSEANCSLHWEAMQYFKDLNIINFDLGDVSSDDLTIHRRMNGAEYFIRCFGGDVVPRYAYMKFNSRFSEILFHSWNFLQFFL